jgi:hypothetical protein
MPKMRVYGTRVRIRVRTPTKGCKYRTQVLGKKAPHSQRIAMLCKRTGKWRTQAFTIPLSNIRQMRPSTMQLLGKLGKTKQAMKLAGVA